jgi:hypothetical protein
MKELYKHRLKTGETIIFKTNMEEKYIQNIPVLTNQYQFYQYFRDRGYDLEVHIIIK